MPDAARLPDRQAIADVLAHYCARLDEYDIDGCCSVFTDGCTTDYGPGRGGVIVGRAATRDRIARGQSVFRRTHHQLGQSLIRFTADDAAEGISYMITWHERFDGTRETVHLRYLDTFVRQEDGWRISSRRVEASGVVGFEGVDWYWVARQPPEPQQPQEGN